MKDLVEQIAIKLHEGWMQYRLAHGVVYGLERTPRTNPHLIPWTELADDEKNQSRYQASLVLQACLEGDVKSDYLPVLIHNAWVQWANVHYEIHPHAQPYEQAHPCSPHEHALQAELIKPLLPASPRTRRSITRALERIGKREQLVVASGCFDILHYGHTRHLLAAAALGDALIVLISDDGSVAALKGQGRPINPSCCRAEVLERIAGVDAVIVHHQSELLSVIRALHPAVFVKGADTRSFPLEHEISQLVGRIERVCVGEPPNIHTSDIIERCYRFVLGTVCSRPTVTQKLTCPEHWTLASSGSHSTRVAGPGRHPRAIKGGKRRKRVGTEAPGQLTLFVP